MPNKLFLEDLRDRLEYGFDNVNIWEQDNVLSWLILEGETYFNFPMLCFEQTPDSVFKVGITESKFFNDRSHEGDWFVLTRDEEVLCIFNLKEFHGVLEIDALEVREDRRNTGIGSNVVSVIESVAEDYYDSIEVSPFDTDAMNFWEHMEYVENSRGEWVKKLNK